MTASTWPPGAMGASSAILPLVRHRSWLFGRFVVSLPFFNYAGVVADDAGVCRALVDAGRSDRARARRDARRAAAPRAPACRIFLFSRRSWDFRGRCPRPPTRCGPRLDRKVRNQVRKAQKDGLTQASGGVELVAAISTACLRRTCAISARRCSRARCSPRRRQCFPTARASSSSPRTTVRSPAAWPCSSATRCSCPGHRRCANSASTVRTCCSIGR